MKKLDWFLLILSAVLYALPFLFSDIVWWLTFIFPIPLLYITCTTNVSFVSGYIWGIIVFALHLSSGIFVMIQLARESWLIGIALTIAMVLYQALFPALLFWCATHSIRFFAIQSPIIRSIVWALFLFLFFTWVDRYCLWIFGITEGYPLMNPLLPLMQKPQLLLLLSLCGKHCMTILFLSVCVSGALWVRYKNYLSVFCFVVVLMPWVSSSCIDMPKQERCSWYSAIKSLPCMAHVTGQDSTIMMKVVAQQLQKIIISYPETEVIIMPESALNITDFENKPELLQLWSAYYLEKPIHLVFGTCRWQNKNYYNSLHWVCNGVLQTCFDKKHAMLITERLPDWMNNSFMRNIYFKDDVSMSRSCNERISLSLSENLVFVPYICSEFFFSEYPDDCYEHIPIIVIVNDMLLMNTYIQKLLLLLARCRAVQWQRDIVYVSFTESLFIDKFGRLLQIN